MQPDKVEKLKKLLELTNEGLTRQEFLDSFKKILDHIFKVESKLIEKIDGKLSDEKQRLADLQGEFKNVIDQAKLDSDNSLSGFKRKTIELVNSLFIKSRVNQKLNEILDNVSQKIDEIDYKLSMVRNGIDGRDGVNGKDAEPVDTEKLAKEIVDKIEFPDYEQVLKDIYELKTRPVKGGGGTSAMGVAWTFKHIAHTEKPSGAIDGANKTYAVNNNIFWIAGFTLNGEQIAELPNFTYTGKTITFGSAIPAAYANKDFEVKYIGT